ncbi:MAG: sulfite exporter TauE/SafE family protein [Phycisphaerales bacterium]|nr:sulfite exporter TauE/SafE family protein [Phycisphaerales bacterium]
MMWAVVGAVVIGLSLGLLGSGGSILTVPVLVYVLGHADKPAIAESLAIVGGIALIGALPGVFGKRVDWRMVLFFGVPAMAGTWLGALVSLWVPGAVQLLIFAIVMLLAAGLMLRGRGPTAKDGGGGSDGPHVVLVLAEGLGVGVLTGLVGVGGGFLIVPALVLMGGLGMRQAVATSLVIIAVKSAAGFWKYLGVLGELDMHVDWQTIGLFIAIGGGGAILGSRIGGRIDSRSLRRWFGVFLVVMGIVIGVKETISLFEIEEGVQQVESDETNERLPAPFNGMRAT